MIWNVIYLLFTNLTVTDDCVDFSARNKTDGNQWTNQTNSTSAATEFWE